jgi:hypothetical protein
MRLAGNGKNKDLHKLLVSIPVGKKPLGRPKRRCVQNIKKDFFRAKIS